MVPRAMAPPATVPRAMAAPAMVPPAMVPPAMVPPAMVSSRFLAADGQVPAQSADGRITEPDTFSAPRTAHAQAAEHQGPSRRRTT